MVTVLKNIAADLNQVLVDDPDVTCLPWTQYSSNKKAIRASRGAVFGSIDACEHVAGWFLMSRKRTLITRLWWIMGINWWKKAVVLTRCCP